MSIIYKVLAVAHTYPIYVCKLVLEVLNPNPLADDNGRVRGVIELENTGDCFLCFCLHLPAKVTGARCNLRRLPD